MIDVYARTFRIATFLEAEEAAPAPQRKRRATRLGRALARWRVW